MSRTPAALLRSPRSPGASRPPARPRATRPTAPGRVRTTARADAPGSHDRIMEAALAEFAARGFAGARVDRIAVAARLNKAMLYYHFGSKARLYRTTIQRVMGLLADRMESVAADPGTPVEKLDAFIATFVRLGLSQPRMAPLMLREIAEGAAHLDQDTVRLMLRVVAAMARILSEGRDNGQFRDVNPLLAYLTTAWPIMVYLASGPVRQTINRHSNLDTTGFAPEAFIRHMQDVSFRALVTDPEAWRSRRADPRHTEHAR